MLLITFRADIPSGRFRRINYIVRGTIGTVVKKIFVPSKITAAASFYCDKTANAVSRRLRDPVTTFRLTVKIILKLHAHGPSVSMSIQSLYYWLLRTNAQSSVILIDVYHATREEHVVDMADRKENRGDRQERWQYRRTNILRALCTRGTKDRVKDDPSGR